MKPDSDAVVGWLLDPEREQLDDAAFLVGLVAKLHEVGVSLWRASTSLRPVDPRIWVRNLRWERGESVAEDREREVQSSPEYIGSPIAEIHAGATTVRERLVPGVQPRFHTLRDFANRGATDYIIHAIAARDANRTFVSYASERPGGFTADELALFEEILPAVSAQVRLRTSRLTTCGLLRTYLGANAAKRVLYGAVERGRGETITAAIWFCDLRDFTALSDELAADRLICVLDHYFEVVAAPVVDHGGEILKFIGDAMLAIFPVGDGGPADACNRALAAATTALDRFATDVAHCEPGHTLGFGVSLHLGEVFYGNIGARDRLDFTVIGPAVNLAARVQGQCTPLGTPLLVTGAFAAHVAAPDLVQLGVRPLKGIRMPPELVTLSRYRAG